jgi:hypothetical protein
MSSPSRDARTEGRALAPPADARGGEFAAARNRPLNCTYVAGLQLAEPGTSRRQPAAITCCTASALTGRSPNDQGETNDSSV